MSVEENHTFTAEGESFSYTLFRKKIKNINLRVMPDGTLRISAPLPVPLSGIENFLRRSLPFIRRARKNRPNGRKPGRPRSGFCREKPCRSSAYRATSWWKKPHAIRRSFPAGR